MENYQQLLQQLNEERAEGRRLQKELSHARTLLQKAGIKNQSQAAEVVNAAFGAWKVSTEKLGALLDQLNNLPQQTLVGQMSDRYPTLLFPVKIETKFKNTASGPELWVRIFPDDIAVHTHEELLTEEEFAQGKIYWTNTFIATDDAAMQTAWDVLSTLSGPNRAAWIVKSTRPENLDASPASADDLLFKQPTEFKSASWTIAPHVKIMPDKFVATGYSGGKIVFEQEGTRIPADLQLAPDPEEESLQLSRDKQTGEITKSQKLSWMFDFHAAEANGMAMRIKLDATTASTGIDRLVVLGLRVSAGPAASAALVEELIDNHHYSTSGFSFLQQGTPTNNTEDASSGYNTSGFENETSYDAETSNLFSETTVASEQTDGQRFADLLGLRYDHFYHITNSNLKDYHEARLMNTALWPATLGYFMSEMMHPLFNESTIGLTRNFFKTHVTGRGPLPAIRVANQPYGILPVSHFGKWKWSSMETGKQSAYYEQLHTALLKLQESWDLMAERVDYAGKSGDPFELLMSIIGLTPGSVEFYQRIGTDDSLTWNYLSMQDPNAAAEWDSLFKDFRNTILRNLGSTGTELPKIADVTFFNSQYKLSGALIDEQPLSEESRIAAYDGTNNYIDWLLNSSTQTITREKFTDAEGNEINPPTAMLYLLLRNAYLQQTWNDVHRLFLTSQVITKPVKEESTVNISSKPAPTKMDYLNADVGKTLPELGITQSITAGDFITKKMSIATSAETNELTDALIDLSKLPTARLERLLTEHLDTCSYRLDAWQTAFYTKRIEALRSQTAGSQDTSEGIYIGAFGWAEDIRPDTAKKIADSSDIPANLREPGKGVVYENRNNGGYIHGVSLNHALTGAVLRSAYLAHADEDNADEMSVNLSSSRVRKALYYQDGIRNGQSLGALLGYQLERGLHENHSPLLLDQYIYVLREAFPLIRSELEVVEPSTAETIGASNVVDGSALVQAYKAKTYPYGVSGLPGATSSEGKAIIAELDALADALDAVGDLSLAESVYQVVQGNFERAGAVMKSVAEGKFPPEPQIVNTPRRGEMITNRVHLHLDVNPSYTEWGTSFGPQASTEKGLNKWLGEMIGDPSKIRCLAEGTFTDEVSGIETVEPGEVDLSALLLQPLELILRTGEQIGSGSSELEKHIAYRFRKAKNLPDSATVLLRILDRDSAWTDDTKTLFEVLPLLKSLRKIVTGCRPLNASDLNLPATAQAAVNENASGYLADDLVNSSATGRLDTVYSDLMNAMNDLVTFAASVTGTYTVVQFDTWREKLLKLSVFGITEAFPVSTVGISATEYTALSSQTVQVAELAAKRLAAARILLDHVPSEGTLSAVPTESELLQEASRKQDELYAKYTDAAKQLLGTSFPLLPRFTITNASEFNSAVANADNLVRYSSANGNPYIAEEWLQGVATVRNQSALLESSLTYALHLTGVSSSLTPVQLPVRTADHWVAVEYPPEMIIDTDILSISALLPATYDATTTQCGLMIDEWTELIPSGKETTGIAFHYDQPNAMPPQTLLLAVTPELKGNWTWGDLMDILNDTLDSAKRRAVEPDLVDKSVYAQFLPAVMTAFSSQPVTISTNFAVNIPVNFLST